MKFSLKFVFKFWQKVMKFSLNFTVSLKNNEMNQHAGQKRKKVDYKEVLEILNAEKDENKRLKNSPENNAKYAIKNLQVTLQQLQE